MYIAMIRSFLIYLRGKGYESECIDRINRIKKSNLNKKHKCGCIPLGGKID